MTVAVPAAAPEPLRSLCCTSRRTDGSERERARRERQTRLADVDRELTLEDEEPLVLVGVDVPRRALAGAHGDLDQSVLAVRGRTADLDDLEHSEQPVRLALLGSQPITMGRRFH